MHVALLTSSAGWRGAGASYAKLARGLAERGHVTHLVTAAPRLTARLREEGLAVTQILGRRRSPREVLALRRTLRATGAQVIVADTPRDVRLAACATLLHRARIVYRYNIGSRRPRAQLVHRVCVSRVAACVYQSAWVHEDAVAHAPWMARIRSFHIPNGYDLARYRPNLEAGRAFRAAYGLPLDALVVLSAANLTRNKGHDVAIAALNRLQREGLQVVYVLAGDGALEGELVSMARSYSLPAVFTGALRSDQLIAAYNAADVVVHPSLQEIFPNAVGEAMACGRPVIAADAGGTAELVGRDGAAGVLVPPGDAAALAAALRSLLTDPGGRGALGEAARRRIQDEYPLARMIHDYEAVLGEVIGAGG